MQGSSRAIGWPKSREVLPGQFTWKKALAPSLGAVGRDGGRGV